MPKYTSEGFVTKIKLILLILTGTIKDKNVILPMKEREKERERLFLINQQNQLDLSNKTFGSILGI